MQGNVPMSYSTLDHVIIFLGNNCIRMSWVNGLRTDSVYPSAVHLLRENSKCDRFDACGLELSWNIMFEENFGGMVDARNPKNKSICQQISRSRTSSCGNDDASSKPHHDSANRNPDMVSRLNIFMIFTIGS